MTQILKIERAFMIELNKDGHIFSVEVNKTILSNIARERI